MATQAAHASVTATVNNGGTVVNAGNVASNSSITKVIGVNELQTGSDYGSKVTASLDAVQAADTGGTGGVAYFPSASDRNFIVRGAGASAAKVNNDANAVLQVGDRRPAGSEYDGINENFSQNRLGTMTFDILKQHNSTTAAAASGNGSHPGRSVSNGGDAQAYQQAISTDAADATDSQPKLSVPGELTYMFGGKQPKRDDYKAKDARES